MELSFRSLPRLVLRLLHIGSAWPARATRELDPLEARAQRAQMAIHMGVRQAVRAGQSGDFAGFLIALDSLADARVQGCTDFTAHRGKAMVDVLETVDPPGRAAIQQMTSVVDAVLDAAQSLAGQADGNDSLAAHMSRRLLVLCDSLAVMQGVLDKVFGQRRPAMRRLAQLTQREQQAIDDCVARAFTGPQSAARPSPPAPREPHDPAR